MPLKIEDECRGAYFQDALAGRKSLNKDGDPTWLLEVTAVRRTLVF